MDNTHKKIVEMIIAVTIHGDAVIVSAPEGYVECFESAHCSDVGFTNPPTKPGVYRCKVEDQSTYDTGLDDEYEEKFEVMSSALITLEA